MAITNTGQLNDRITFCNKQTVKVNGVAKTNYVELSKVWASVWTQSVKDRIANIGNGTSNTVTFIIRDKQSFEVTNDLTISHQGIMYEIKDANRDVHQKWMTIICEVSKL